METDTEQADRAIEHLDGLARRHLVECEGLRVCWRAFGEGPPLVLLHGGHGNWLHWVRNIEALATRFSVWVPDLPGYGDSGDVGVGGLSAVVEATVATLDHLIGHDTPIHLAAFSFGSLVAAQWMARRPSVMRVALLGPVGHGGLRRPRGELRNWREAAATGNTAALAQVMHHNLSALMLHDPAAIDALALRVHTTACQRTRFRSRDYSHASGLLEGLTHHQGPLLLIWGEHDVTADPPVIARVLSKGRVGCHTDLIEDAGHWVQFERAPTVNQRLLDWFCASTP